MYKYKAQIVKVIDGDTVDVVVDVGFKMTTHQRVRLAKVDTPETFRRKKTSDEYKAGMAAKNFVKDRLKANKNKVVIETEKDPDLYGRYLATIWLADKDISLNDELLETGHATLY